MSLTSYGHPLTVVSSFKYLGWVLLTSDDGWLAVIWSLQSKL